MKLRQILRYIGVSNANMEEGNFRCDANISLRPVGSTEYGAKVEIKNMNSLPRGARTRSSSRSSARRESSTPASVIPQETRGWVDDATSTTVSQRSKEEAHDYRYFPEPDLPPVTIETAYVEKMRARLPELPDAKRARFQSEYGLSLYDANLLAETRARGRLLRGRRRPGARDAATLRSRATRGRRELDDRRTWPST